MKAKTGFICLLLLIGCFLLIVWAANSAETDPYPTFILPIYKDGYNLQKSFDTSKETKSIRYFFRTDQPPTDVLEFYDTFFNGSGWYPSFEICQRNWDALGKETGTTGSVSRQLFASWDHPELDLKAELWLTYEMIAKGAQNEVRVKCRLQPMRGRKNAKR